jgi:hypothetical protein
LQLFYDNISALFAEKASSAPAEGNLMVRDPAAGPAPDLHVPSVEVRILLQDKKSERIRSLFQGEQSETKNRVRIVEN